MNTKSNKKLVLPSQPDQKNYEVGYAKPPVSTRFKPGVSGNPHGRPRGAKNKKPESSEERLKQIILDEYKKRRESVPLNRFNLASKGGAKVYRSC